MVVYRRETRGRTVLLVLVAVSIVLITVDSGGNGTIGSLRSTAHNVIAPAQSVVNDAFRPLRNVAGGITSYASVKNQNAQLRREVADLRGQLRTTRGTGTTVTQLEKLLDLPTVGDATGIAARVTGGTPGNFERTVQIDKGSNRGIQVGYPVLTGEGLVGTVTAVAAQTATVTLIDSPTIGVGVRLQATNTSAITSAKSGSRGLTLGFLSDLSVKPQEGELVSTASSPKSAFPPEIPVGTVSGYSKGISDLQPTITITPVVNLSDLDYVKVLRYPDPTAAPPGG
jgi:rod shape-determining protein MreC